MLLKIIIFFALIGIMYVVSELPEGIQLAISSLIPLTGIALLITHIIGG